MKGLKQKWGILLFLLISGSVSSLFAQRWSYSTLDGTYSYNTYSQNYYMYINYSEYTGGRYGFRLIDGGTDPFFQVDTKGAITFGSKNSGNPASITFMDGNVGYAQLNTNAQNFNVCANKQVRINVRGNREVAIFDANQTSIFNNLSVQKDDVELRFGLDDNNAYGWIGTLSDNGLYLGANRRGNIFLDNNYGVFVGIGAAEVITIRQELKDKFSLFVRKGVLSEDFAIAPKSSWSDFVFYKNYRLKPLAEVECFIENNRHLPDVPSAAQVAESGYSQHEINKILLQKIEELTLYTIEQEKRIQQLEQQLNN